MTSIGESLPRPSAFILDLDGTALNSQGAFSEATTSAVRDAIEARVPVMIATARSRTQALGFADRLGLTADARSAGIPAWVIHSVGAVATDATSGKTAFEDAVPAADARAILQYGRDRGYAGSVATPGEQVWDRTPANSQLAELLKTAPPTSDLRPYADHALAIRFEGDAAANDIADRFGNARDRIAVDRDTSLGCTQVVVTAAGVDKGSGIRKLLAREHLDPARAYMFGDSHVDLAAFGAVGVPVAMGNATPDVKAAARFQTASNDDDGVARLIEAALHSTANR